MSVGLPVPHGSHQWSHTVCVSLCLLLSLSVVSSGSVLVVVGVRASLLFVAEQCSHGWRDHALCIHPPLMGPFWLL